MRAAPVSLFSDTPIPYTHTRLCPRRCTPAPQVDFKEDHILNMARVGFFVSIAITLATNAFIKRKVLAANDTTSIWVPPPQSGFLPDPNAKLVKSTYAAAGCGTTLCVPCGAAWWRCFRVQSCRWATSHTTAGCDVSCGCRA